MTLLHHVTGADVHV